MAVLDSNPRRLWYDHPPGTDWNRALPLGSGRLGAMVFGNTVLERLQLNEDSVWSGGPRDRQNSDALRYLPEIRRLIQEGNLACAHKLAGDALAGTPDIMRFYEPLADLVFAFEHGPTTASKANFLSQADRGFADDRNHRAPDTYRRWLDLDKAVAVVEYTLEGTNYRRENLASAVDGVVAIRIIADRPGAISFRLRMDRGEQDNYATRFLDTVTAG